MGDYRPTERDVMAELHRAVAMYLLDRLETGDATSQDVNVAVKFLKDNNIVSVEHIAARLDDIAASLPELNFNEL